MRDADWAKATVAQKLDWIRRELQEQNAHTNRVSARLQKLEKTVAGTAASPADQQPR